MVFNHCLATPRVSGLSPTQDIFVGFSLCLNEIFVCWKIIKKNIHPYGMATLKKINLNCFIKQTKKSELVWFSSFVCSVFSHIRCRKCEQKCLDFRHYTKMSELCRYRPHSNQICVWKQTFGKPTSIKCLTSILVWISNTCCTLHLNKARAKLRQLWSPNQIVNDSKSYSNEFGWHLYDDTDYNVKIVSLIIISINFWSLLD